MIEFFLHTRRSLRIEIPGLKISIEISTPNMTGRSGGRIMEMIGGSSVPHLARTPCVPLFSLFNTGGGNRRVFRLPGEGGDYFYCTVEPSPGHTRCRRLKFSIQVFHMKPRIKIFDRDTFFNCRGPLGPRPAESLENISKESLQDLFETFF